MLSDTGSVHHLEGRVAAGCQQRPLCALSHLPIHRASIGHLCCGLYFLPVHFLHPPCHSEQGWATRQRHDFCFPSQSRGMSGFFTGDILTKICKIREVWLPSPKASRCKLPMARRSPCATRMAEHAGCTRMLTSTHSDTRTNVVRATSNR